MTWPFRRRRPRNIITHHFEFPIDAEVHFVVDGAVGKEVGEIMCILPGIPRIGEEIFDKDFHGNITYYKITRVVWDLNYHGRYSYQRFWPVRVHVEPMKGD